MRDKKIKLLLTMVLCLSYLVFGREPVMANAKDLSSYSMYENWAYGTCGQFEEYVYIGGYADENATELAIPSEIDGKTVKKIDTDAFKNNTTLQNIIIPNTVDEIGNNAFYGCTSLKTVNIPTAIDIIGDHAFFQCNSLGEVTLPEGLTKIGLYAFSECNSLTTVTIPASVELSDNVGKYSFSGCQKLATVTMEDGMGYISEGMFKDCIALTSIIIPDSVTRINDSAFAGCVRLSDDFALPKSIYTIGKEAFKCCTGLKSIIIPNSVVTIGDGVFASCSNLERVTLSGNLQTIGESAFSDCGKLDNVVIPSGTESIYSKAFYNCSNLKSICVPASVKDIYEGALSGCNENITIHTEKKNENDPQTAIEIYAAAKENNITNPIQYDYTTEELVPCYVDGEWKYKITDENTITIVKYLGDGEKDDKENVTIRIPDTLGEDGYPVTEIGECAFLGKILHLGYTDPWKIFIPDTVKKIGDSAFNTGIGFHIWIPSSVTEISESAFSGCGALTVYIGAGAENVVDYMKAKKIPYEVPVTKINFSKSSFSAPADDYYTLEVGLEPAKATNTILKWSSSNVDVADVDSEGEKGFISTGEPGTAIITATATNGMTGEVVTATCEINVTKTENEEGPGSGESGDNKDPSQGSENPPSNPTTGGGTTTGGETTTDGGTSTTQEPAKEVKVPSVSKVSKFKASAKKKALALSWKKVKNASGYQVQVSTKKNFKGAKTISVKKTKLGYTASKLKSKKKYYVRIRAYVTYKDASKKTKKAYGKWVVTSKTTK